MNILLMVSSERKSSQRSPIANPLLMQKIVSIKVTSRGDSLLFQRIVSLTTVICEDPNRHADLLIVDAHLLSQL